MTCYKENSGITERLLRIAIIAVVLLSMAIPLMDPGVFAASSVSISGGDSVKGGDKFTVAVTFGGGSVGRVDGQMTYDTDKLTYLSGGSSSGNSGYIQLKQAGTDGSVTFNIEFQAIADGNASLEVTTNEMYDLNERYMSETPSASKTISISGSAAEEEIITQTTSPDKPVKETELIGVDEKEDEDGSLGMNLILIISAAVLAALIVIIAVVLNKKKKSGAKNKKTAEHIQKTDEDSMIHDGSDIDPMGYGKGRSMQDITEREHQEAVRKRASEETELWEDWKGSDDGDEL